MGQLKLEKTEKLDGTIFYYVVEDSNCLFSIQEVGANAQHCTDGRTVAHTNAAGFYEECLKRQKEGYPKTTILAESKIQANA